MTIARAIVCWTDQRSHSKAGIRKFYYICTIHLTPVVPYIVAPYTYTLHYCSIILLVELNSAPSISQWNFIIQCFINGHMVLCNDITNCILYMHSNIVYFHRQGHVQVHEHMYTYRRMHAHTYTHLTYWFE